MLDVNLKLAREIDDLARKIVLLNAKEDRMSLSEDEEFSRDVLTLKFLQKQYIFIENIFGETLEPFLYNDKVIELKSYLEDNYNWDGRILYTDGEIEKLLDVIDDVERICNIIEEIKDEELKEFDELLECDKEELERIFDSVNVIDESTIRDYIEMRYYIMSDIIRGENSDEEIEED